MLYVSCTEAFYMQHRAVFGEVKGLGPPGRPRSSFNDVALRDCQNVEFVDLTGMHKTGCFEETTLILHVPAHHELESVAMTISLIITRQC